MCVKNEYRAEVEIPLFGLYKYLNEFSIIIFLIISTYRHIEEL